MNGSGEKINNNTNESGAHWDSLSDIPFNTGGGYQTESGIILTGEAGREKMAEDLGVDLGTKPQRRAEAMMPPETASGQTGTQSLDQTPSQEQIPAQEQVTTPSAEQIQENLIEQAFEQSSEQVAEQTVEEAPVQPVETVAQPVKEAAPVERDEQGAAAVEDFMNKINSAKSAEEIEQAIKLGYSITSGANNFSPEEKQRAQKFMASPIFRKRQIENDIAINEKRLSGMEDTIRRSEEEYEQIRKGGIIARFKNRFKIRESRDRVARAKKIHDNAVNDIARWREELTKFDSEEGKVA